MSALDIIPLSTSDYIADTQHLTLIQHGAYLLILMAMWRAGGWIPDDDKKLAVICKLSTPKWRRIAADVRALLMQRDGKLSQKRLLFESENALKRVSKNRLNGSLGGKAKYLKNKETDLATASVSLESADNSPSLLESLDIDSEIEKKKESERPNNAGKSVRYGERRAPRRMIPENWALTERDRCYAGELGFEPMKIEQMATAFHNYHRSHGTLIADMAATWRTWCGNEIKFAERRGHKNGARSFADIARGK